MGNRGSRLLLATLVAASVAGPAACVSGEVPAPVPAAAPPSGLAGRYAAGRAAILAAERDAVRRGHRRRAAALREMADPARRFLSFDGRDAGRAVEVFGDLATAARIAVLVPGAGITLDKYGLLRGGSMRLRAALGDRSAVIAWLGYATPSSVSLQALTLGRADRAAPALRAFLDELRALRPGARISLLCHSYGSAVCGRAAPGLDVAALVLFGSPGAGAADVAALRTRTPVWAGRTAGDWVGRLPHASVELPSGTLGLGGDPVAPGFGARVFDAGRGGHSDYLAAGSTALANLARIVTGSPVSWTKGTSQDTTNVGEGG
ncbi:alpha/beta hydrolase [Nonomuraea sp. NPDC049637]|uniref:alpha/beta hydrolase n=1 Tax=Nonomuraea sp. NPDC049637 TaxID=3154356 RepID=UPI0034186CE4